MNTDQIKRVLEAALLCSASPLSMTEMRRLFDNELNAELLRPLLDEITAEWAERPVELVNVASGWRFQSQPEYAAYINRLTPEKAPKYSRAVMETLAIVAYRQPVTRGDIEEIRGVSVSSQIIKTLEERGWIDVIGHKEVPGRPALFGSTRQFLDDLGLVSIKELPSIDEMGDEDAPDFFTQPVAPVAVVGEDEAEAAAVAEPGEPEVVAESEGTDEAADATAPVALVDDATPELAAGEQTDPTESSGSDDGDSVAEAVESTGIAGAAGSVELADSSVLAESTEATGPVVSEASSPTVESAEGIASSDIELPEEVESSESAGSPEAVALAEVAEPAPEPVEAGGLETAVQTGAGHSTEADRSPAVAEDAAPQVAEPLFEASEAASDMDELSQLAAAAAAIGLQKQVEPEQSESEPANSEKADDAGHSADSESMESR